MIVEILFYIFGTVLVLAALGVITSRNPVYSALSLVLCFVTSAAIWLLIEAEFLAVVLVLVYVGAVMVLFLFVVMMLDINLEELRTGFTRYAWLGWLTALAVIVEIVGVVWVRGVGIDVSKYDRPPLRYPDIKPGHDRGRLVLACGRLVPYKGFDVLIRAAVGRDYADVPPTRGTFKGNAESELAVAVTVEPTSAPVRHNRRRPMP